MCYNLIFPMEQMNKIIVKSGIDEILELFEPCLIVFVFFFVAPLQSTGTRKIRR